MLQAIPRDIACKTRGQDGFAALLSRRALSSPTTCRFIPALSELPTIRPEQLPENIRKPADLICRPCHRGTAQCKAACNRFPYTLRATGHENSLAFELTAKNGKWIAVCHGPSKKNDDSKDV